MKWEESESGLLLPKDGDKIICLDNNWDQVLEDGTVLVNGLLGECSNINISGGPFGWECRLDFTPDSCIFDNSNDVKFSQLKVDYKMITQGEPTITRENYRNFPSNYRLESFDYGYAITCHKSQGSEYPKVLVFEEVLRANQHKEWLYTAVTRASEKLTLVLKD
jgi:exodeoxyribonuclease-5